MRIRYHDLYDEQFENLVAAICRFYLGKGLQEFSTGPDGGRDARFVGTANEHVSKANQFSGKFVVQAKHTENPIAKVSDKKFSSDKNYSTISKEKKRIKRLIQENGIEHYLLFTNRREGANKTVEIQNELESLGLDSAYIFGIKNIDSFLKLYPKAETLADISFHEGPLRVVPDDLAKIILKLKDELKNLSTSSDEDVEQKLKRVEFKRKNEINGLSDELGQYIIQNFLTTFDKIDEFLAAPANENYQELYIDTADEFNAEIIERLAKGHSIDSLLHSLIHRLKTRDGDLKTNKRLTRAIIYYMYWKCDLGFKEENNVDT